MHEFEPRVVPLLDGVNRDRWYCLDCGEDFYAESSAKAHWRFKHAADANEEPANGVDYATGAQLTMMAIRREVWINEQEQSFQRELRAIRNPHDFISEAEIRSA